MEIKVWGLNIGGNTIPIPSADREYIVSVMECYFRGVRICGVSESRSHSPAHKYGWSCDCISVGAQNPILATQGLGVEITRAGKIAGSSNSNSVPSRLCL